MLVNGCTNGSVLKKNLIMNIFYNFCYLLCIVFIVNLGLVTSIFLECTDDRDCIANTAYCNDNSICQCPSGQVYNVDGTECLDLAVGFGSPCIDDNQCSWLLGKHVCSEGACACEDGWWYYNGKCRRAANLGQSCNTTENCYNGYDILAMVCSDGICTCSSDYYLRGNYDCRPKAQEEGDYCSLDSDCANLGADYVCRVAACVLSNRTNDTTSITSTRIALKTTTLTSSMLTLNSSPQDEWQSVLLSNNGRAITNITCESMGNCSIENTVCYTTIGSCICRRGYFVDTTTGLCSPELGVYSGCTGDNDCGTLASRCINGTCYCRKTYFTLPGNLACQKPMTNDNLWCRNSERCYVMGTSSLCINNRCSCAFNAELDDDYICRVSNDTTTPSGCNTDSDCSRIQNSVCDNGNCVCPDNYRYHNRTTCLPNLGAQCDGTSALCTINHASCSGANLCQCDANYVASEDATTCYQVAQGLGVSCQQDLQCSASVNNSVCSNDVCTCTNNYINIDGNCYLMKAMGDRCSNVLECRVTLGENVYCRRGICQCLANMTSTGLDCVSGTSKLHFSFYSIIVFLLLSSILYV